MIEQLVDAIESKNPLQGRSIRRFMARQDGDYWKFAESLSERIYFLTSGFTSAADAYNRVCMDLLSEQVKYSRTGVYSLETAKQADDTIYSLDTMRQYVVGLLMSYLFWPNHYKMWQFYTSHIQKIHPLSALEIGAGHGLFSAEAIRQSPELELDIIDISKSSIRLSREMMKEFGVLSDRILFTQRDFLKENSDKKYDLVIMGEVLEHVDNAPLFLQRAYESLDCDGRAYLSTCANCPAPDHIWHFRSIDDIRTMIYETGFCIESDLALPVETYPSTINYCAFLYRL